MYLPSHSLYLSLTHTQSAISFCLFACPSLPFPFPSHPVWRSLAFSACIYGRKILRHKADSTTKCDKFATPTKKNEEEESRKREYERRARSSAFGAGANLCSPIPSTPPPSPGCHSYSAGNIIVTFVRQMLAKPIGQLMLLAKRKKKCCLTLNLCGTRD